ncbi:ABC transporter substrate-binding protein [Ochrobactrum haematophilum]|uniref:ABC transporter substrate-binding protein n=1 Tax=Brucella haematophila TaxID=419474 RepID=A0ABX1DSG3_9HYPH|nr:ABC transporter substrate-binding protein [Brucella haematophila]
MGIAATMARADDIKIGFAAPLTGPQAYFGTTWLNGVQLTSKS